MRSGRYRYSLTVVGHDRNFLGLQREGSLVAMAAVRSRGVTHASSRRAGKVHLEPPQRPHTFFKPEFTNRVDEVVRFRPLGQENPAIIVSIQLGRLRIRLAERRLSLTVAPEAEKVLAAKGYDPAFGARPLRRVIQREMEDQLALVLLDGRCPDGSTGHGGRRW